MAKTTMLSRMLRGSFADQATIHIIEAEAGQFSDDTPARCGEVAGRRMWASPISDLDATLDADGVLHVCSKCQEARA